MKIAAVVVGTDDEHFRRMEANDERVQLAERIARATKGKADVVLLPAGFLTASADRKVGPLVKSLAKAFGEQVLLAGVDVVSPDSKDRKLRESKEEASSDGDLPFWGFAARAGELLGGPWPQRSAFSGQAVADPSPRCVSVGKATIGVMLCGEIYNHAITEGLAEAKPDLVVDLAHISMKRFTKSLHRVSETVGCPVLHVQHVALGSWNANKWMASPSEVYGDPGVDWASYNEPDPASDKLWAEVKLWNV